MSEKLFHQDGDVITEYTPEQYAQYALDQAAIATAEAERAAAEQAIINAKTSRDAKLVKMGFIPKEIATW